MWSKLVKIVLPWLAFTLVLVPVVTIVLTPTPAKAG